MTRIQRSRCILLCVLLCATGCGNNQAAGGQQSAACSVQMLEFNKDLQRAVPDDKNRTTYEIFVYSFCDSNGDGIGDWRITRRF